MAGRTLAAIILVVTVSLAWACSIAEDHESQSLQERVGSPKWVVYGRVVSSHMPVNAGQVNGTEQEYTVLFQPICWLKKGMRGQPDTSDDDAPRTGDDGGNDDHDEDPDAHDGMPDGGMANGTYGDVGFKNITVKEVKIDCVENELEENEEYVLFLERRGRDDFRIVDVNEQSGAIMNPEDQTFEELHRGIDAGMSGKPRGKCLEGVDVACFTETSGREECNQGVRMGVAAWLVVVTAAMATIGF